MTHTIRHPSVHLIQVFYRVVDPPQMLQDYNNRLEFVDNRVEFANKRVDFAVFRADHLSRAFSLNTLRSG